jgi:hypothetical protein
MFNKLHTLLKIGAFDKKAQTKPLEPNVFSIQTPPVTVSARKLRDITKQELEEYEWVDITTMMDSEPIYLQGYRKTKRKRPPDDGYAYVEVTQPGDAEQKWKRMKTYVE